MIGCMAFSLIGFGFAVSGQGFMNIITTTGPLSWAQWALYIGQVVFGIGLFIVILSQILKTRIYLSRLHRWLTTRVIAVKGGTHHE